jgi:hypothetical protein
LKYPNAGHPEAFTNQVFAGGGNELEDEDIGSVFLG